MPTKISLRLTIMVLFISAVTVTTFYFSNTLTSLVTFIIGGLLGATLNYFHFGFSSSFRSLLERHQTIGMRAIVIMLGLAILLFLPLLQMQEFNGQSYTGLVRPLSLGVILGAFIFGIGMQIGCGCTSGTLNKLGQMQALALPTLIFMIVGGTLAAASFDQWRHLPTLEPYAFHRQFNWLLGLFIQFILLSLVYFLLTRLERKRNSSVENIYSKYRPLRLHPFVLAAILLAALNATLFTLSGTPWSIATIFPYWGVKLIELFDIPIDWLFWEYSMENQNQLQSGIFVNQISLTTMGVIIGALAVSMISPRNKMPLNSKNFLASIAGGLLMGFGAVLASGCNIGAFFSGIASGSLHGWVWFLFALLGNYIGLQIRNSF